MSADALTFLRTRFLGDRSGQEEIVDLWRGDARPLLARLASRPAWSDTQWSLLRYELSLLAGRPVGELIVREDRPEGPARWVEGLYMRRLIVNGGGPRHADNPDALREAFTAVLEQPLNLEAHRQGLLRSLEVARAWRPGAPEGVRDAIVLARHHTELPHDMVALMEARSRAPRLGPSEASPWDRPLGEGLEPLSELASDPGRFEAHVVAGLGSPSEARRGLSLRLLAREGQIDLGI